MIVCILNVLWRFFQEVVVLDPDLSKDYLDRIQNRTKEKRYAFDHAFGPESKNSVYVVEFICYGFLYVLIAVDI